MINPKRYKANDKNGHIVHGWYVLLHLPRFDNHDRLIGFEERHFLFNDEPLHRNEGCYWHEVNPNTLKPLEEQTFLDFSIYYL